MADCVSDICSNPVENAVFCIVCLLLKHFFRCFQMCNIKCADRLRLSKYILNLFNLILHLFKKEKKKKTEKR